jgi:transposase-like protein
LILPKPIPIFERKGSPETEHNRGAGGEREGTLETVAKGRRRTFRAVDKVRIVKEADRCVASGKRGALGAMLRREGIYSSQLASWRMRFGAHGVAGLKPKKAGRKARLTDGERRYAEVIKRNAVLEKKLHIAQVLIALQKKAHEVLGLALPESEGHC